MHAEPEPTSGNTAEHRAIARLAEFLHALAGGESVRTREALAAAIANRVTLTSAHARFGGCRQVADGFHACLDDLETPADVPRLPDDRSFMASLRIARRAVSGALRDPTGGASRWHHLAKSPAWAQDLVPSAWIGDFLFYGATDVTPVTAGGMWGERLCRLESAVFAG